MKIPCAELHQRTGFFYGFIVFLAFFGSIITAEIFLYTEIVFQAEQIIRRNAKIFCNQINIFGCRLYFSR